MRITTRFLVATTGISALLAGATACSDDPAATPRAEPQHRATEASTEAGTADTAVDSAIFERVGGEGNGIVYRSPTKMALESDVVALGTVVGVSDGYETLEHGTAAEGYDIRDRSAVLTVKVTHLYKGTATAGSTGFLYLTVSRGAAQEGVPDDGGPSTITPVADFRRALPTGSPVVVMAGPVQLPAGPGIEVIDRDRGVPSGETLLSGWHSQAMTFASDTGSTGWPALTLAEITEELDALP